MYLDDKNAMKKQEGYKGSLKRFLESAKLRFANRRAWLQGVVSRTVWVYVSYIMRCEFPQQLNVYFLMINFYAMKL